MTSPYLDSLASELLTKTAEEEIDHKIKKAAKDKKLKEKSMEKEELRKELNEENVRPEVISLVHNEMMSRYKGREDFCFCIHFSGSRCGGFTFAKGGKIKMTDYQAPKENPDGSWKKDVLKWVVEYTEATKGKFEVVLIATFGSPMDQKGIPELWDKICIKKVNDAKN